MDSTLLDLPQSQCRTCHAPLTPAETQGLCARCLLEKGGSQPVDDFAAAQRPLTPPPLFPFDFGAYRIVRLLGRGGMGAVYEAEDSLSGRRVALKVLSHSLDSVETRKRFLREGRLAAAINHPNSVYVYGTEEIDATPVITMELVPGGTLQERVQAGGPLPVGEAVEVILQVIEGLEAAHSAGILHRDIKPSNCFLEPGGAVKIGDFGLSISTQARGDSNLTMAGAILGTPAFSSPEQLRGEALDVRADIYSVGVTLYYLLTGRVPFQAENMVALLANVLDKAPPSPRSCRAEIPEPLARVILRCLAKAAGDRFANYDGLRRALVPFTSTAPTPATLGLRFAAGVLDYLVFTGVNMVVGLLLFGGLLEMANPKIMSHPAWLWFSLCAQGFDLAYFAVGEGRWGATLGKALVGLRVGDLQRNAPGVARALLRALIFLVPTIVSFLFSRHAPQSMAWNWTISIAYWAYPALLALTARRHNGFATVTDLLTKTRVIQRTAYQPREAVVHAEEQIAPSEAAPQIGPYHALATLAQDADGELLLGYDTKLTRRVWIRRTPAGTAPVAAELRQVARPSRLRWLQGQRADGAAWDAYEATAGTPLTRLLREPQPWKKVRRWLLDLAEECATAVTDGSLPAQLSLDHIWITEAGGAKLLDFPASGAEAAGEPIPASEPAVFLNQLAISALEGRVATAEEARTSEPRVPVALRARRFLHGLRQATDLGAIASQLQTLLLQRPAISRARRLGLVAGCVIPALLLGGFTYVAMKAFTVMQEKYPDLVPLKNALSRHEQLERGVSPDSATSKQALETYIAGRFGRMINDQAAMSSPYAIGLLTGDLRPRAAAIVTRVGDPSEEAMAQARATLGEAMDADGELKLDPAYPKGELDQSMVYGFAFGGFFWAGFFSLAAALLCRGGLLMRALGIAVVRRDGTEASRLRMLWRAGVAWFSFPLGGIILALLMQVLPRFTAAAVAAAAMLALVTWSAVRRGRSLQDCLAGTWLVPR